MVGCLLVESGLRNTDVGELWLYLAVSGFDGTVEEVVGIPNVVM